MCYRPALRLPMIHQRKPGFYSLTVPTGGGKTLSGLAFSLRHAAEFMASQIIYVAPYLSILDQNAREIVRALGVAQEGTKSSNITV